MKDIAKTNGEVTPRHGLELLSQHELSVLSNPSTDPALQDLFRCCALAVLNTGNTCDNAAEIFEAYNDFSIEVSGTPGPRLIVVNAPASAFIDGRMIEGIRQHLFSVLRDVVYIGTATKGSTHYSLSDGQDMSNVIFQILKQAHVMDPRMEPNLAVCWGGHSISRTEYDYSKEVGYHLGLRGIDICTGCGPGAMKGPMKGAAVGHAKQRNANARHIGLTEPGIIAAEPPNPVVTHLVILPDIEKRLEAFLRLGHCMVVFPGGVGTLEEILYLMGVLLDPANAGQCLPVVFTGPESSVGYFSRLDRFLVFCLGAHVREKYTIIIGNPVGAGVAISRRMEDARDRRRIDNNSYYFNWMLKIPEAHQQPFTVTHESVAGLRLTRSLPVHELVVELRKAFSAIVTGNVKDHGIRTIRKNGPFQLTGELDLAQALDELLIALATEGRMKLKGKYQPCYTITPAAT
ncbi:MAG: LOG family protein [Methylococcus sp.]|nr:MAG: LOG family protein [Methylococcus sp.]